MEQEVALSTSNGSLEAEHSPKGQADGTKSMP